MQELHDFQPEFDRRRNRNERLLNALSLIAMAAMMLLMFFYFLKNF